MVGERQVNHYSFYAAFHTPAEWRLVAGGKTLGTVPISQPLREGVLLIFAGKRWKVTAIDTSARVVELEPSGGGNPPMFRGGGAPVSDRVRAEMVAVYESTDIPAWLDPKARQLLAEGRAAFRRCGLSDMTVIPGHSGLLLLPWVGDRALFTASIALSSLGIEASVEGPAILIHGTSADDIASAIRLLLASPSAFGRPTGLFNPKSGVRQVGLGARRRSFLRIRGCQASRRRWCLVTLHQSCARRRRCGRFSLYTIDNSIRIEYSPHSAKVRVVVVLSGRCVSGSADLRRGT